jgi:histidinol-phosphate/aromatic aminotransferase/cobyric acid decarboxylase-like protein/ribosomal protein S18 acetylase RimI-like enzyme
MSKTKLQIAVANGADRDSIYRLRHTVYAEELAQHPINSTELLSDIIDDHNLYIVARVGGEVIGFVSLTLPGGAYSIDKYLSRDQLPVVLSDAVYEARLLTVAADHRQGGVAGMLMYAAFRMIESRRGNYVIGMGRKELQSFYAKAGLQFLGVPIKSGEVNYELMGVSMDVLRACVSARIPIYRRLQYSVTWDLPFLFEPDVRCFHGGAAFEAIGDTFQTLERRFDVVNADVLDASFPPAPRVISTLHEHLPWLLQTSPPTEGAGLVKTIAEVRGVPEDSVVIGAGSSSLMFLALRQWLSPESRVLLPDPTYAEYAHVLSEVIGCQVDRLVLSRAEDYRINVDTLRARLHLAIEEGAPYDLVVIVNPNNPTGGFIPRPRMEAMLSDVDTRFWIDEAYIDYLGPGQTLEPFAAMSSNAIVCKSLSKCYALSGVRVAYLCGPLELMQTLRRLTPPWSVGLPAQVAAVEALKSGDYYDNCYREMAKLRDGLVCQIRERLPHIEVSPGAANWVLCYLPADGPDAAEVRTRCRERNVFVRNAASISSLFGTHTLRIAVKDSVSNKRIVDALAAAMDAA